MAPNQKLASKFGVRCIALWRYNIERKPLIRNRIYFRNCCIQEIFNIFITLLPEVTKGFDSFQKCLCINQRNWQLKNININKFKLFIFFSWWRIYIISVWPVLMRFFHLALTASIFLYIIDFCYYLKHNFGSRCIKNKYYCVR